MESSGIAIAAVSMAVLLIVQEVALFRYARKLYKYRKAAQDIIYALTGVDGQERHDNDRLHQARNIAIEVTLDDL